MINLLLKTILYKKMKNNYNKRQIKQTILKNSNKN